MVTGIKDLMQILSHVVEEVRDSVGRDINGSELLYGLLNAPWLQSLLKVYECLQQHLRSSTRPHLSYASGLSLEILSDLRALPYPSHEARELYTLLTEPHLQALLSAHDVVGLKDYEPILPPLPEDLPDDEEAMRIVCLVKNKQPLKSRVGRGIRSHWDTLRNLTHQRLIPSQRTQSGGLCTKTHETPQKVINSPAEVPSSPKPVQLKTHPCSKHAGSCKLCHQSSAFCDRSLSCSAPCVCSSVVIDDFIAGMGAVGDCDMGNPILPVHPHYTLSPWTHIPHSILTPCCYPSHPPPLPPRMARYVRTAPPSPLHCHRVMKTMGSPPVELAKQDSLDELRSTVQQAASCMERSSQDVKLLGQRMAAATERMSDSVQENAQALAVLAQVVKKLQGLVVASSAASAPQTSEETSQEPTEWCSQSATADPEETCEEPTTGNSMSSQSRDADLCISAPAIEQLQGRVSASNTAPAPRTVVVHFEEMSKVSGDGNVGSAAVSIQFGNANPCQICSYTPIALPILLFYLLLLFQLHQHFPGVSSGLSRETTSACLQQRITKRRNQDKAITFISKETG
ncbi:hypothetical protein AOLI_G00001970 [Acnodon oligacanthus]